MTTRSLREFTRFIWWIAEQRQQSLTLRPSHMTWAVSSPVGSYRLHPPSPFIIITQPESWYLLKVLVIRRVARQNTSLSTVESHKITFQNVGRLLSLYGALFDGTAWILLNPALSMTPWYTRSSNSPQSGDCWTGIGEKYRIVPTSHPRCLATSIVGLAERTPPQPTDWLRPMDVAGS